MKTLIFAATTAFAIAATATNAATITATNLGDGAAAYSAIDPNLGTTLSANLSFDASVVSGNINAVQRSPFDSSGSAGVSGFETLTYFAVGPSHDTPNATLTVSGGANVLNLLWGSIDGYNSIEFFDGSTSLGVISNSDIAPTSSESTGVGASYVSIFSDERFDSAVFISPRNAFEISNISVSAVPLPASSLLLLGGVGGLVALRRRKNKS